MNAKRNLWRGVAVTFLSIILPRDGLAEDYQAELWRDLSLAFEEVVRVQRDMMLERERDIPDAVWIGREYYDAMVISGRELRTYAGPVSRVFSAIRTHEMDYLEMRDLARELPPVVRALVLQLNSQVDREVESIDPASVVRWILDRQNRIRAHFPESIEGNIEGAREEYEEAIRVLSEQAPQPSD